MSSAETRLLCLLGHPVAHSISPQIHTAALAALGLDAVYLAFDVAPHRLADALAGLRALPMWGANVTVPHKQAVGELADSRTDEAVLVGAANTLFFDGSGQLVADNTDAVGLHRVLTDDVRLDGGDDVLLFGAGGAARAAAVALGRLGARVAVRARRAQAAAAVEDVLRSAGGTVGPMERPRLVVNATPLGLHGEALPDDLMRLDAGQVALDLVYGPADTPFLAAARRRGAHALDGLGMLVAQAAGSFERWTQTPAPRTVMLRAAETALGR